MIVIGLFGRCYHFHIAKLYEHIVWLETNKPEVKRIYNGSLSKPYIFLFIFIFFFEKEKKN